MGEGDGEGLEVAGVAGSLARGGRGGALDVADALQGFAAFREEEGLGEKGGDEVLAGGRGVEVAQRMEDPVAQQARAHRGGGAVEHAEQRVLLAGAGVDEVEIPLRGGVDEDVVGVVAHRAAAGGARKAAELVDQVVEDRAGRADGGVEHRRSRSRRATGR